MVKSVTFLSRWHPRNGKLYIADLYTTYGARFFWMMISVYVGVKGSAYYFLKYIQLPYYQSIGHDGAIQQEMFAVSYVPWTAKGFIGVISDCLPLLGYQKTTYMVIYTLLGSASLIATGFLPLEVAYKDPIIAGILMFFGFLQTAAHDLLMEGKYVQQMNKMAGSKPNIVSFAWFATLTGQIIPSTVVGTVSDYADPRILFFVFTVFAIQPLIPIYFGGMVDDRVPSHENNRINTERIKKEWKLMLLATLMGFGSLGTVAVAILTNATGQIIYSLSVAFVLCILAFFMIPAMAARFNVYNFLAGLLYTNLQGALEYYYTEGEECVPNGPKFSYTFLKTYGQLAGTLAQIGGMFVFQVVMSKWKFRHIFWSTTAIRIGASVFDIILVNRWNLAIGIPDPVLYMIGFAVVYQLAYMMDFVPGIILTAKLCAKDVEATMFALLAGYGNYGTNTGNHLGVFLMDIFGIQTKKTETLDCNWDNLTYMILLGHGLLPAISIALAFILIPDAYLTDSLVDIMEKDELRKKGKKQLTSSNIPPGELQV